MVHQPRNDQGNIRPNMFHFAEIFWQVQSEIQGTPRISMFNLDYNYNSKYSGVDKNILGLAQCPNETRRDNFEISPPFAVFSRKSTKYEIQNNFFHVLPHVPPFSIEMRTSLVGH
jgi:hypothetical protein